MDDDSFDAMEDRSMTQLLGEDQLHEIIGLIYKAAIDPGLWRSVMERVPHRLHAAALLMLDFSTNAP